MNPLLAAIAKKRMEIVDLLLEAGADVNICCDGITPLLAAVEDNNLVRVSLLCSPLFG